MPVLYALFALLVFVSSLATKINGEILDESSASELEATSNAFLVYRNQVSSYRYRSPGFEGRVADVDLELPSWFQRQTAFDNLVSGGVVYAFYPNPPAGLVGTVTRIVESVTVGTNVNGVLHSLMVGDTGIALPAAIPQGALVIRQ